MANDAKYRLYLKKSDGQEIYAGEFAAPGGADGISITGATVNSKGHLILTLSNSQTVDAGEVKGSQGDKGAVYTPSVSSDGVISWTNNGNLSNPTPVNIKGKNGDPGVSVTGATIEDNGHLIISLSEGDPIDAGYAKGDAPELSIVSNPTVGDDGHGVAFYVDGRQVEYFEVMDGDDGFSPIVEIQQTVSGHMVTITDKAHGEQSFEVLNGTGGGSGGGGSGLAHLTDGDKTGSIKSSGAANTAIGYNSFALGSGVSASGDGAFAQNFNTKASGKYSHAEGSRSEASGTAAHAEGMGTVASNYSAHAEGTGTIAAGEDQHVQGRYNVEDGDNKYLHIVGNGENENARSNAHTIDANGNAWFKGKVFVGGAGMDDPNAKELGAGGVTDINELLVKELGYVVPETTLEGDPDAGGVMFYLEPLEVNPTEDYTYIVKWNGVEYNRKAMYLEEDGQAAYVIGNFGALGMPGVYTDPFVFLLTPDGGMGIYAMIVPLDGSTEATVSIKAVEYSKIPTPCMPENFPIFFVNLTGSDVSDWVADKTFAETKAAFDSGCMVFFKVPNNLNGMQVFPLVADGVSDVEGMFIMFGGSMSSTTNGMYIFKADNSFMKYF